MHSFRPLAVCVMSLMLSLSASAQYQTVAPNPYGERPVIVPVPDKVAGLDNPVLALDGRWRSVPNPPENFYEGTPADAQPASRGGGQGRGASATGLLYNVTIPASFAGHRVVIRFNNTAQSARLWVNGRFVRDYWGSMGAWTADITDFVKPGEEALVAVKIERTEGLGAFVRFNTQVDGTCIYALPERYVERMRLQTDFDDAYKDAEVELWLKVSSAGKGSVRLSFTDNEGRALKVTPSAFALPDGLDEFKYKVRVSKPLHWDAEHPNLYQCTLSLTDETGKVTQTIRQQYGFREIETRGNRLYVNGQEVKFRGMWGGGSAAALRSINVNHTRQKWATEAFLDSCDVAGIYVLDENSVDFAKFGAEQDPQYAGQWLALIQDKMERDFNHPSVVMWGLGNESFHGDNVLATHKYARFDDPSRPTMFSWANRVRPDQELPYSVYSYHYSPQDIDLSRYDVSVWHSPSLIYRRQELPDMPVLVDEGTHVCISMEEITRDPNVRNFWGESIRQFWNRSWNTAGSLGIDQFGLYRYLSSGTPEAWMMRKAFSPVVIAERDYEVPAAGKGLVIDVENRFCHTDLSEMTVEWKAGQAGGVMKGPAAQPGAHASLVIPYKHFKAGDVLSLAFKRADGLQVDEYLLDIGRQPFSIPAVSETAPEVTETAAEIVIKGKDFVLTYNKYKGQITSMVYKGETVLTGGPHLQLLRSGIDTGEYWPQSSQVHTEGGEAVIDMDVIYSPFAAAFQVRVDNNGLLTVHYTIKHIPDAPPAPKSVPWDGADVGGYSEVGVKFTLPSAMDRLSWRRRGLWSVYPEDHIGREQGVAYKTVADATLWKDLDHDLYWSGGNSQRKETSTNDFRSSKEYFSTADVLLEGRTVGIEALSEERDAVRLEAAQNGAVTLHVNNEWNYPTLGIGNYMRPAVNVTDGYSNTVYIRPIDVKQ